MTRSPIAKPSAELGEKGRTFSMIEVRRQRRELVRRDHGLVGIGPVPHSYDDAVADCEALRRSVDLDHVAGRLDARRERQVRLELIFAGRHQYVRKVDARRADRDTHLPCSERQPSKRLQPQPLGRAERAANDGAHHQAARSLARASASRTSGRRSLPKYMSVLSMKMVGEPKPPRAITSSVLALSWSLTACRPIATRNFSASTPTRRHTSASTASCEMSWSSP